MEEMGHYYHQQHLEIFEITAAVDILFLPQVVAKRQALLQLYKAGGEEIAEAEDEYLELVNSLCEEYGFQPYFIKGPEHPKGASQAP